VPAAEASPTTVSISGSPAATSEPKASSRIASVTGQEISSDLSIADLLASLKSDHMPGAPLTSTRTPGPPTPASPPFKSSAARTMSSGCAAAPASTTAVRPSGDSEAPALGGITREIRSSAFKSSPTAGTAAVTAAGF